MKLEFNEATRIAAIAFFTIYALYGVFRFPFVQYLVSLAVGAIAYGVCDSYEAATIALLLAHFLCDAFLLNSGSRTEGFDAEITDVKPAAKKAAPGMEAADAVTGAISGVSAGGSEGFADAGAADGTLEAVGKVTENTAPVTATSAPAAVVASPPAADAPKVNEPAPAASATPVKPANTAAAPALNAPPTPAAKDGFQSENSLFKLGQIPTESKGGFHIDAGTTVINALNALKPDQITAMTKDTKQLIDTQKSLMNMLQTFTPMVNEGKQMMDTFNNLFTPAMGAMKTSSGMLGDVKGAPTGVI